MEGEKFKRTLGGILVGIGLLLLLFAVASFMTTSPTMLGLDVQGWRKAAPTIAGIIFLVIGVSMINRT